LFLLESELGFLRYLKKSRIPLNEYEFPESKLANITSQFEKLVERNYLLNTSAKKDIFNVHSLDLQKVSKSFGLTVPPRVNLNVKLGGKNSRKRNKLASTMKQGNKRVKTNNRGGDERQFSR